MPPIRPPHTEIPVPFGAQRDIYAMFTAADGAPLPAQITLFQLADGRIGVGVYPIETKGTVLRWDRGPDADPSVIHWGAPHCDDDKCGSPCSHKRERKS